MLLLTKKANKTPWKLILTTEAFSSLTNQFMQILLPWYVLSTTGSVWWTGVVGFCALLPNIFSSVFGGQVIDKFGRSKTMFVCEVSQLVLIGFIAVLVGAERAETWLIGLLVFASSVFDAPGEMARTALSPTFSRYAGEPLSKTSGLIEAMDGIMSVAGPLLCGAVIAWAGLFSAWVMCAAFCAVIVLLCLLVFTNRKPRVLKPAVSYRETLAYVRKDKIILESILFTLPTFLLGQSWELIILPTYIYEHGFSSLYLGMLGGAFGLGAFIGALAFASAARRFKFFALLTFNYVGYLLSVLVLLFPLPKAAVLAATVLCGVPFGAFGAMMISIILLRTPVELRGKMLGVFATATYTVESLCVLGVAACIDNWGLNFTLCTVAAIFAILIFVSLFGREKRDFWTATATQ